MSEWDTKAWKDIVAKKDAEIERLRALVGELAEVLRRYKSGNTISIYQMEEDRKWADELDKRAREATR